jgi:AAA domain
MEWQFSKDTFNYKSVDTWLGVAKKRSLFVGIASDAGIGKTASLRMYTELNQGSSVFYLSCREWSRRDFLTHFCNCLNLTRPRTDDDAIQAIINGLNKLAASGSKPLVILDEADKLKEFAVRTLIPIYNGCEKRIGLAICGTKCLETQFSNGVSKGRKGYDELSSRFGRNFYTLPGCTINCIFDECKPTSTNIFGSEKIVKVVYDLRKLERAVERELELAERKSA